LGSVEVKESGLQRRIRHKLEETLGGWWVKFHGGPFTPAGVPDLIGCVSGIFFALEVKRPKKGRVSDIQHETIAEINDAGGHSCVVTSVKEALRFVTEALIDEGRNVGAIEAAAKKGRRVHMRKKRSRPVFQTKTRKDVDHPRGNRKARVRVVTRHRSAR
jgi:hypothetical protein